MSQVPNTEWEDMVTEALTFKLDVTRSDAQSIVEVNQFKMLQSWALRKTVEETAAFIAG